MIFIKYLSLFVALSLLLSFNVAFAVGDDFSEQCARWMSGNNMMGSYSMMNYSRMGGEWGLLSMILAVVLQIIIWAVVIVAIIALVKWLYAKIFKGELLMIGRKETAEDVLKMRYAKGELTKEQYEDIRKEFTR